MNTILLVCVFIRMLPAHIHFPSIRARHRSEGGEKKIRVFARRSLEVLDLLAVCSTNDCAATTAEKLSVRFAYHRRRRRRRRYVFLIPLRFWAEIEGCRTKKVYGLQSTPGESVESTIVPNFLAFVSHFAFLDETCD